MKKILLTILIPITIFMTLLISLLLVNISIGYPADFWGYYLMRLSDMTPLEISLCEVEFDKLTQGRYTKLHYARSNAYTCVATATSTAVSKSANRQIAQCYTTIEKEVNTAKAIKDGKIVKLMSGEYITVNGKIDFKRKEIIKYDIGVNDKNDDWHSNK